MARLVWAVVLALGFANMPGVEAHNNTCTATVANPTCTFHCHATSFTVGQGITFRSIRVTVTDEDGGVVAGKATCVEDIAVCGGVEECTDSTLVDSTADATCELIDGTQAVCSSYVSPGPIEP